MADQALDLTVPSCLHLVSAFLAMEPPHVLLSLARLCGGGSITHAVQSFIWDNCLSNANGKGHVPYLRNFLKKLIAEVESHGTDFLEELYEKYAFYVTSLKDEDVEKGNKVLKCLSFIFPHDFSELPSCPESRKLVIPLQCSLNMLEGDTGCSIWPSSLFLSEFILSYPELFSSKFCFEVGSGVGLVGLCLAHVKPSKVILSDGDLSSLANMKHNLKLNQLSSRIDMLESNADTFNNVECMHLPWESATQRGLQDLTPDIVLGADVIYDPVCIPHLIQVLVILLNCEISTHHRNENCQCSLPNCGSTGAGGLTVGFRSNPQGTGALTNCDLRTSDLHDDGSPGPGACPARIIYNCSAHAASSCASREHPVAYIASVIRNADTFNCFLTLADRARLNVTDLTDKIKPFDLLPYMQSYQRNSIRLFSVTYACG